MTVRLEDMFNEIQQQGINSDKAVNFTGAESHTGTVTNTGTVINTGTVVGNKSLTTFTGPTASPTPAQLGAGIVADVTTGAGNNVLMPTGSALGSAFGATVGTSFRSSVFNTGTAGTATILGSTGTTVIGSTAIGFGKNADLQFYESAANVWSVYVTISA